jgi:SAM-dependent methyltransferase
MTSQVPQIFEAHRRRALQSRITAGPHLFVLNFAATELCDRAASVNRRFGHGLIVAPRVIHADFQTRLQDRCQALTFIDTGADDFDSEVWTFDVHKFDLLIVCGVLHCVNDLPGSLVQIRNRLQPDGILLAALAGGDGLSPLRQCLIQAESEITGGMGAHFHPSLSLPDLAALMQRAGFALPVVDLESITARYQNLRAILGDIKAMGEANCLQQRDRRPLRRDVLERAEHYYRATADQTGDRLTLRYDILFATGWAPHESQPKALRPGSAQHRLADALGTTEIKIPDGD